MRKERAKGLRLRTKTRNKWEEEKKDKGFTAFDDYLQTRVQFF